MPGNWSVYILSYEHINKRKIVFSMSLTEGADQLPVLRVNCRGIQTFQHSVLWVSFDC